MTHAITNLWGWAPELALGLVSVTSSHRTVCSAGWETVFDTTKQELTTSQPQTLSFAQSCILLSINFAVVIRHGHRLYYRAVSYFHG